MTALFVPPRQERRLLFVLAGIQFSHILDFMIMMPLGPMLMADFAIGTHEFGLLVASYSFCAAVSSLTAATFVDRFERKGLLLTVFALFAAATLACGLAPGFVSLLAARGLAGAFGGLMGALVHTMVGDAVPYPRRARAGGAISMAFSLATVAGVPASLWLANHFHWRAAFYFIALFSAAFLLLGRSFLPQIRHHLEPGGEGGPHLLAPTLALLRKTDHLKALAYSAMIIFSGFTVIPYLTVYAVGNVGIALGDIPYVYLAGGAATLLTARRIGRWADQRGKVPVYRRLALLALLPLLAVTQLGAAPLEVWLACTTAFFVLVSGRMIPAMTIIVSAVRPQLRGTFMSLNATVQSLAMGLATTLGGFLVTQETSGRLVGYDRVGYVAIGASLLAVWFVGRIVIHDTADAR